ncbi:hypothetical protein RP20_CCG012987 [Aedes albopictus]|nr:hypothetical protein RP20_CCG012987 [Aedes albopictus]
MTNDFRNLFYSRQEAIAQHHLLQRQQQQQQQQQQQYQQQFQKPLQPLQQSQQINQQLPASFYPNNRFNNPVLNNNYGGLAGFSASAATALSSAAATMTTEIMATTHNQTMIMKAQNKENLYHGYGGMALQQQQIQQMLQQRQLQQQQQQQQQLLASQTKQQYASFGMSMGGLSGAATITTNPVTTVGQATASSTGGTGLMASAAETGVSQSSTNKIFERRQQKATTTTLDLQYLNCNSFGYGLLSEFYEPPKPDTPPSRNIPYWIDPIWSNDPLTTEKEPSASSTEQLLNIPLPELKTYNKLPVILTPYVLSSLSQNPSFSFDFDKSKQI